MIWPEQWRKLAARIKGLIEASDLLLETFRINSSDTDSVVRRAVLPELEQIKTSLRDFCSTYEEALPRAALEALAEFLKQWHLPKASVPGVELRALQAVVPLAVFRATFEFLVEDVEAEARTLTELAFEHLRRLLAVNASERERWEKAFTHETRCEKLGAVHLLSHGIWAFKISGASAATDLVYAEPITDAALTIRRTARALVLTEWKMVRRASELEAKAAEGRNQARSYSTGVLADLELKGTRYIVLVTESPMTVPPDVEEGPVTYRHVVLPINSPSPSRKARLNAHNQGSDAAI